MEQLDAVRDGDGAGDPAARADVAGDHDRAGDPSAREPTAGDPTAGEPTAGEPTAGELLTDLLTKLRGQRPGLTEILDVLAEAVTIRDPHHRILYANRAALDRMGFSSLEEIQKRSPHAIVGDYIVHDEAGMEVQMDQIPSVRLLAGQSGEPLVIRTINRTTGELHWDRLKAAVLSDDNGEALAAVTIIEDITQEKTAEQREHFLATATQTLMSSLDYEETLRNVAWLAVPEIADWCLVDLIEEQGQQRHVAIAHPDPERLALAERLRYYEHGVPDPDRGIGLVIRTGIGQIYPEITDQMLQAAAVDEDHLAGLREAEMRSVVVVPMRARGRTIGVMTLVTAESRRRLGPSDLEFAEQLAARAAVAVDNARLATSRLEVAQTLQRSLLPETLPAIDGWEIAATFRPSGEADEVEVGGDFYDFFETPDGWIVLMGDVTGRGIDAAAVTSLVRHGARFLAKQHSSPGAILSQLDEALRERSGLWLCSAVCLHLGEDAVEISSAGHPSPLIVRADGRLREIGATGPILGAWRDSTWSDHRVPISPQETILLYTDGVTDARAEHERYGVDRLKQMLVQHAGEPPQRLLAQLSEALDRFEHAARTDDMAMLALRRGVLP